MTQAQHTPGLYVLTQNINDTQDEAFIEYCVEDANGGIVGFFRNEANARLIVASVNAMGAMAAHLGCNPVELAERMVAGDSVALIDAANALRKMKAASAESSQELRRVYYSSEVQSVLERLTQESKHWKE